MIIAELRQVTKRYGPVTALANLDLAIERSQLLTLLGRNGAGKTTAVRLLLGLATPHSGTARVFGRDPREPNARRRTGAMLQVGRVPDTLRVRELIDLFSSYYPKPLSRAEVIHAAGLEGIENRLFSALSGGQRQRVLFALAICGKPDLLVLDEPTTGLDVESRRSLWRHIREFVAGGGSVLLTTHYLEEADALADRIAVLDRGRIVAAGAPHEIKQQVSAKRIRCLTTLSDERILAIPGVTSISKDGAAFEILTSDADRVVPRLFSADPDLHGIEVTSVGLEDAFLAITSQSQTVQEVLQ
jgi:ABC-2 type transport system ATP-binding protein